MVEAGAAAYERGRDLLLLLPTLFQTELTDYSVTGCEHIMRRDRAPLRQPSRAWRAVSLVLRPQLPIALLAALEGERGLKTPSHWRLQPTHVRMARTCCCAEREQFDRAEAREEALKA